MHTRLDNKLDGLKSEIIKGSSFKRYAISLNGNFSQIDKVSFRNASNSSHESSDLGYSISVDADKLNGRLIFLILILYFLSQFLTLLLLKLYHII